MDGLCGTSDDLWSGCIVRNCNGIRALARASAERPPTFKEHFLRQLHVGRGGLLGSRGCGTAALRLRRGRLASFCPH